MKNVYKYVDNFFMNLELWEDKNNDSEYKNLILQSIINFMDKPTAETAYCIYEKFFNLYWIGIQNEKNPFIDLLNKMKDYEIKSGQLLKKQRDHYMHSVYVFILGICVFQESKKYQEKFNKVILNKEFYPDSYNSKNEEFFYRWGIASLFHDIAYPLEITINQANIYLEFISSYSDYELSGIVKAKLSINGMNDFNKLPRLSPKDIFEKEFEIKYPSYNSKELYNSIDILANYLAINFNLGFSQIKKELCDFEIKMQTGCFIDHGYYSALIVMRWYYYLFQKTKWNPAYFYFPIVDVASAILLHNYYKHGLQKHPFDLGSMSLEQNPIAYLLILCDELQEWNRPGYGEDKLLLDLCDFDIVFSDSLKIIYKVKEGGEDNIYISKEGDNFINGKIRNLTNTININDLFDCGIDIKLEV